MAKLGLDHVDASFTYVYLCRLEKTHVQDSRMALLNFRQVAPKAVLAGSLMTAFAMAAAAKPAPEPRLKSSSVLIIDQSDSSILYSRNSDVAAPIASITKLMTALVVLDARQSLDEPIEITESELDLPKLNVWPPRIGPPTPWAPTIPAGLPPSSGR
jgi:serine-type D-Ala-D-Ala endopeptidase (penicillin-binding protein 7)